MLQNPSVAFRDPVLKRCRIEKDQRGQPRPWSGAFAVVYKGIHPDGSAFAVRVFTTESSLPERVADDRLLTAATDVVGRRNQTAVRGNDAEQLEEAAGNGRGTHAFGLART